jgi:dATP pyrophosphohydrolase
MVRAQYEVTIFPFRRTSGGHYEFAIFFRSDLHFSQGIAGGGEDDESPLAAAKREAREEAGISDTAAYYTLSSIASIPTDAFESGIQGVWPKDLYVIPGYYFGVNGEGLSVVLSSEHTEFRWVTQAEGERLLRWDHDKTALWELNARLRDSRLPNPG